MSLNPIGLFHSNNNYEQIFNIAPSTLVIGASEIFKRKISILWSQIPSPKHWSTITKDLHSLIIVKEDPSDSFWVNTLPVHNSYSFTINFDTRVDDYENYFFVQGQKLIKLFEELKSNGTINRLVMVYEHGKHGKVHWHGVVQFKTQTTKKDDRVKNWEKPILRCCSYTMSNTVCLVYYKIKDKDHRKSQYLYMMKEPQNEENAYYYI